MITASAEHLTPREFATCCAIASRSAGSPGWIAISTSSRLRAAQHIIGELAPGRHREVRNIGAAWPKIDELWRAGCCCRNGEIFAGKDDRRTRGETPRYSAAPLSSFPTLKHASGLDCGNDCLNAPDGRQIAFADQAFIGVDDCVALKRNIGAQARAKAAVRNPVANGHQRYAAAIDRRSVPAGVVPAPRDKRSSMSTAILLAKAIKAVTQGSCPMRVRTIFACVAKEPPRNPAFLSPEPARGSGTISP